MTDRIKLYCRPKCETCKGTGHYKPKGKVATIFCPDCTDGYNNIVMEFKWNMSMSSSEGESWFYESDTKSPITQQNYRMKIYSNLTIVFLDSTITDSLSPTHLEVIKEKECSDELCEDGVIWTQESWDVTAMVDDKCGECNGKGKIEVVTQKILFKPDEYDETVRKEVYREMLESYGQSARNGGIASEDLWEGLMQRFEEELKESK